MSQTEPQTDQEWRQPEGETRPANGRAVRLRSVAVIVIAIAGSLGGYGWYARRRSVTEAEGHLKQATTCFYHGDYRRAVDLAKSVYEAHEDDPLGRRALRLMVVAENEQTNKLRSERRAQLERENRARDRAAMSTSLEIVSAPAGASVVVDGKPAGVTPLSLTVRKDEKLKLRLRLDGYEPAGIDEKPERHRYEFVLALVASWKLKVGGPVTHTGSLAERNAVLVVPDRSGRVSVVDLANRRKRFEKQSGGLAGDVGKPIVYDDFFIVVDRSGTMRAFDTATGRAKWTCSVRGPLLSDAARIGDSVLVASEGGVISAVHKDGEVIKSIRIAQRIVASPASDGERTGYVLDTAGLCHAVDDTGRTLWSVRVPDAGMLPPVVGYGRLLIAADDNCVHALDARDGRQLWTTDVGDALRVVPMVLADKIYVVSENRELLELRPRDGRRLASRRLPGRPSAAPSQIGGALLVPVRGHGAFVIDPTGLSIRAQIAPGLTSEVPVIASNARDVIFASDSGWLLGYRLR